VYVHVAVPDFHSNLDASHSLDCGITDAFIDRRVNITRLKDFVLNSHEYIKP
jgi:hypothetical protein